MDIKLFLNSIRGEFKIQLINNLLFYQSYNIAKL